jgi:hypothetical protein
MSLLLIVGLGCGSGGSAGPDAGGGGHGGSGATAGGAGGVIGGGGQGAGQGGNAGGAAGPSLHVTFAEAFPASIRAPIGVLIAVTRDDTAVVVTPSSGSTIGDPGATITWFPAQGARRTLAFPNVITPNAMTIDKSGAIWLIGQLYQAVSFGGPTLQPVDNGYYLVKLAADGSHLASVAVSRTDVTFPQAMAADGDGNIYVAGGLLLTTGTVSSAVFLTKFSSTGTQLYDQTYVASDTEAYAQSIAFRKDGDLVLVGFFNSTLKLGTTQLTSAAGLSSNGFVAVIDHSTGAARSAFSLGGATLDSVSSVQVTTSGSLRIAGQISGTSMVGDKLVQADPRGSAFIADLTDAGVTSWVQLVGAPGIIAHGDTNAADRTFGAGHIDLAATSDAILATVGADGQLVVPLSVENLDGNGATSCAADLHGGVWVGGEFQGSTDLGTGPISGSDPTLPANFLAHLEP